MTSKYFQSACRMHAANAIAAAAPLAEAAGLQLVKRISEQTLSRTSSIRSIWCMSHNSHRDELFLVECMEDYSILLRTISLHSNSGDLQDVFTITERGTKPDVRSVCHMSDSVSLLVCYTEYPRNVETVIVDRAQHWLVALSRRGNEWRETPCVQTERVGLMCCALADSRVLVGEWRSKYLEMFRVENGPRIAHVHRISVPEEYKRFTAICINEVLIAMSFEKSQTIRVHRLDCDKLVELSRIQVNQPCDVLWLADRFFVTEWNADQKSHSVLELKLRDGLLEQSRELIHNSDSINVFQWCAVNNGLAIYDDNKKELL